MNLRERLNAIGGTAAKKKQEEQQEAICLTVRRNHPFEEFPGWEEVDRPTLMLMQEEELPQPFAPERVLYLDTETTGFQGSGTVAFIIGAGFLTEDGFQVRQFIMRDYSEEPHQLKQLVKLAEGFDTLCSFNGKSFDVPLLRSRFLMNRIRTDCLEKPHIDLLHIARRVWKLRLKQCSLGRLEEELLGKPREDDLPGSEAPKRFFEYLKSGDFQLIEDVRRHNEQDVASMCTLLAHMCRVYREPERLEQAQDLLSMGNALQRTRHGEEARRCYRLIPAGRLHGEGQLRLAGSWRRSGRKDEAVEVWRQMLRRREGGPLPYVELAKYYEHTAHDTEEALRMTRMAMAVMAEPSLLEAPDTTALR